jgi:hypothetical protein
MFARVSTLAASCLSLLALFLALLSPARATGLRTVALTGDVAPGTPAGVVYSRLVSERGVVMNASGRTAFSAYIEGNGIHSLNDTGVWSEGAGTLDLVVRNQEQAPGTGNGVQFWELIDNAADTYILDSTGQTVFAGTLVGNGVDETNLSGLWFGESLDSLRVVARRGDPAPGAPPGAVFSPSQLWFPFAFPLLSAGRVAFSSNTTPTDGGSVLGAGIWLGDGESLELVARTGDPAPGMPSGIQFSRSMGVSALNSNGQVSIGASLQGDPSNPINNFGIWVGDADLLRLVARTGDPAPGTPAGIRFASFGGAPLDSSGSVAFGAKLVGDGIVTANDFGIWAEDAGVLVLVARKGTQAPGTPDGVVFGGPMPRQTLNSPALNSAGQIIFSSTLSGPGVDATNNFGIWSGSIASQELVVRRGDPAPGITGDARFSGAIFNYALNNAGRVAFMASVSGGDAGNTYGIWAQDAAGELQLIVCVGDSIEVAPGDFRTINFVQFIGAGSNTAGRGSAFNDLGQIAFSAAFTDGSEGIFVSNAVAVAEPSTAMASLCFIFSAATIIRRNKPGRR